MHRLTLYHREGCHLCENMLKELEQLAAALDFAVVCVDIDADAGLKGRYKEKIPVLALGEDVICCHSLDERALRQALSDG